MNRLVWAAVIAAMWMAAGAVRAQDIAGQDLNAWEPLPYDVWTSLQAKAEAGDGEAAYKLYNLYIDREEKPSARFWLEKAADNGQPDAIFWSFWIYDGREIYGLRGRDYAKAFGRLKQMQAAEGDSLYVASSLGDYYRYGFAVTRDYAMAVHYYTLCADPKDNSHPAVSCQLSLSDMYADGLGIAKDDVLAYVWYALGAEQWIRSPSKPEGGLEPLTPEMVKRLANLKKRLTPAQLLDAQARIAAFRLRSPAFDAPPPPAPPPPLPPVIIPLWDVAPTLESQP